MAQARLVQVALIVLVLVLWHMLATPGLLPPFYFEEDGQAAFFFGEPLKVAGRFVDWFVSGEIWRHLGVTLVETALAFVLGTALGLVFGLWFGLSAFWARVLEPFLTAMNAMPRIILAPIFMVWFGLGIWSKVALAVTLVFFVVFFNVYQGIREVSPTLLNNARILGAGRWDLLRRVYVPSATSWVFASLHNAVGLAFAGAVVGEYLGSSAGVGYLIQQAEGVFDINTVFAGIVLLTLFAVVLDIVVGRVERHLLRWQPQSADAR